MSASLRFDVTLTKADIVKGRLLAYFRSGIGVLFVVAGLVFTGSSVSMRFGGLAHQSYSPTEFLPVVLGVFIIPMAVAFAGINSQAIKNTLGILQYDFSNAGFRFTSSKVTANVEWSEVRRAYESSNYFVLTTPGSLQILPKHAIEGTRINDLRLLLGETLGKKAKLKKLSRDAAS